MAGGTVTVTGAGQSVNSITLDNSQTLALAQQIALAINTAAGVNLTAFDLPGVTPVIPPGNVSEAVIPPTASGGTFNSPGGVQFLVDAATVPVTINGAANQTVLSGTGGITYFGAAGAPARSSPAAGPTSSRWAPARPIR
jgi:hypothetical protein